MKSGKNVEMHLAKLMTIYKGEMRKNKSGVPKEFSKYLDAFMWMKGELKFGTHFLKLCESSPVNASIGGDWSTSGVESDYGTPNENNRMPQIGCDKAKKDIKQEENSMNEERHSTVLHQHKKE